MTQNIYDDSEFFEGYSQLDRSIQGLNGAAEWPAIRALLPELSGLKILDLGCGFGWFCRWAREHGAAEVLGMDISENMLARARAATPDAAVVYRKADLEAVDLPTAAFNLVYSSLAFHYVRNFSGLMEKIQGALVPGGQLIFSVEHPIYMAPRHPDWVMDAEGREVWPLDGYLREGPRTTNWLAEGVIKQHRTLGTTLNTLIAAGFAITHVEEWGPSEEQIAVRPDWAVERERPMFLIITTVRLEVGNS